MTIKQEFNELRREAKRVEEDHIIFLSGTKNKKARLLKEFQIYKQDLAIDSDLGIINIQDYEKIIKVLEKSIEKMEI